MRSTGNNSYESQVHQGKNKVAYKISKNNKYATGKRTRSTSIATNRGSTARTDTYTALDIQVRLNGAGVRYQQVGLHFTEEVERIEARDEP